MVVVLDRISKDLAVIHLGNGSVAFIEGLLDFRLTYNTGAAWGLFEGARPFFIVSAIIALGVVVVYLFAFKQHTVLTVISLGLFAGGSIGNGIDRVISGRVVDFLHLLFIDFPVFNLADSAISVGVVLLLIVMYKNSKESDKTDPAQASEENES